MSSKTGLSKQQKNILGCIYVIFQKWSGRDIITKSIVRKLYTVCAKGREGPTRSDSASFSRAMKQLWNRDLVKYWKGANRGRLTKRTTGVSLTEEGSLIAKEFATEKKKRNFDKLMKNRWIRRSMQSTTVGKMMEELNEMVNSGLR